MNPRQKVGPDSEKVDAKGKARPDRKTSPRKGGDFDRKTDPEVTARIEEAQDGRNRVEVWKLDSLKRHSMQDLNFHPLSDPELEALAEDMRRNGQRTPIEVTPDRRIIDGHQRELAARMNGSEEVRVLVRHDLAGDEAAIERRMIEANMIRRQLDVLDRVRLARRLLEIKEKRKPGGLSQYAEQDLRDRIGEALGMSGRHIQRYLNILNAPMPIQRAYSEGRLSMRLAENAARLEESAREAIAAAIAAGGDPADVVAAHLPVAATAETNPDREYEIFLKAAAHAVGALGGWEDRVRGGMDLDAEIAALERTGLLIARLIARHKAMKKQRDRTLSEISNISKLDN